MGARKRSKAEQTIEVKREPSPDYFVIYSDAANIDTHYFGLKLTFGNIVEVNPEKNYMRVCEEVTVGMSPEHAYSLYKLLEGQLGVYQERFGALRSVPGERAVAKPASKSGAPYFDPTKPAQRRYDR